MASDSLIDRILGNSPVMEGALRRRLTAGALITLSLLGSIAFGVFGNVKGMTAFGATIVKNHEIISEFYNLPLIAALLLILILAVGTIADVLSEIFILRAAGGVRESIRLVCLGFCKAHERKNVFIRIICHAVMGLLTAIILILWIASLPLAIVLGMTGVLRYHTDIEKRIDSAKRRNKEGIPGSDELKKAFHNLPPDVQNGFRLPFSEFFDVAVSYLYGHFTEANQELVKRKVSLLRDFLSYILALVVAMWIPFIIVNIDLIGLFKSANHFLAYMFYIPLGAISILFLCYFLVLQRTIITLIALAALDDSYLAYRKKT